MFLVDASVFPGSSGSPVLVAGSGAYMKRGSGVQFGERILLMGILAAVYRRNVPVLRIPTRMQAVVEDTVNVGIIYKSRVIDEMADEMLSKHGLRRAGRSGEAEVITDAEPEQDAIIDASPEPQSTAGEVSGAE